MSTDFAETRLGSRVDGRDDTIPADYLAVFDSWAERLLAERAGATSPQPPRAFVAGFFADSSNPLPPSAYPEMGSRPGCATPVIRPAVRPAPLYINCSYARVA